MYDVIVVGARCAGAPLAMLLARAGHRVALVDRASFPSDTMSTHFLWQRGAARLQAWGLLGRLHGRGCAPIREITFDAGPVQLSGIGPAVDGVADTYCPRRTVLDALLAEAAEESGAELIEGFVVGDVLWSEGRAVGVRGHHRTSPAIVAAGQDRRRRRRPALDRRQKGRCPRLPGVSAAHRRLLLLLERDPPSGCVLPCPPRAADPGLAHQRRPDLHLCRLAPPGVRPRAQGRWKAASTAALELVPGLRDAVASGRREARFTGTGDLPNLYRTSAGPGWALAGDAGHHKDPSTGMGMSDAFLAAELLADAIHDGLAGHRPMDQALAGYQHRRDALTGSGFELTLSTARLAPLPPRLEAFYRTAAQQPELSRQIFGVLGGSLPAADVYPDRRLPAATTRGSR